MLCSSPEESPLALPSACIVCVLGEPLARQIGTPLHERAADNARPPRAPASGNIFVRTRAHYTARLEASLAHLLLGGRRVPLSSQMPPRGANFKKASVAQRDRQKREREKRKEPSEQPVVGTADEAVWASALPH